MEEIKIIITTPSFWFVSIFVAFFISLFASYSKDWVEKIWAKISMKRQLKIEQTEADFLEKVEHLNKNPNLVYTYQVNIVFLKLRQILYILAGYFCMFLGIHNFLNGSQKGAIAFIILCVIIILIPGRLVTRDLNKRRAIVNKVIDDEDIYFNG